MDRTNEKKGNILLVDDLPNNLQLLSDLLINLGYTVRSVTSGKMALKTLQAKRPDLILLDIKMPEMDGYQVCEMIKQDEDLQDIPIIFISALDDTFDKVKAFECGGVDYITKPFQIEEVIARIEGQLTIQRQRVALKREVRKRREAEEVLYQSRALLSSVLNSALDGIAAMQAVRDPQTGDIEDFRCLVINPILSKAFNRNREDLIGRVLLKRFLHRLDPQLFEQFVNLVETGTFLTQDIYFPMANSDWYHFVAVKLGDGFAITVRDITDRKRMELELQAANQQLQLLANIDGLTHIANRRRFDEYLAQEWQRHYREQKPLTLLLVDIDYFKAYNDFYGHQQGDDCLQKVAQTLVSIAQRVTDLVARYGGEEFVVILPNTNQEDAMAIAQKMLQAIAGLEIPHQGSTISEYITISIGISTLVPTAGDTVERIISEADQALYRAKSQGRNQAIA
ncbi:MULTISPECIES: high salinity-induced biofilm formation responseregulaton Rre2 [unclassified Synechocystis]|uniref:high salinity-induced biofilm formation responseregulaton Rre2 n=1 Tax=unclassified Synechocystis TaxID=2640012 RepID=UPI00040FDBCF|nr:MULTISPECIES: high salinity-induced biofilm formation responseregulaton Rre2 [unclassified Synechocystis]AIE74247.1 Two-component response regulator [Synechocystis sp. PCC 6714]MCT0252874.1 diguanylate cyclase [Synechocystis sp. CS-94]